MQRTSAPIRCDSFRVSRLTNAESIRSSRTFRTFRSRLIAPHNEPPVSHMEGFGGYTRILGMRGEMMRSLLSDFPPSIIVAIRVAPQSGGSPELNIGSRPFSPDQELLAAGPTGPKLTPRKSSYTIGRKLRLRLRRGGARDRGRSICSRCPKRHGQRDS